jgi:hypothetical protein
VWISNRFLLENEHASIRMNLLAICVFTLGLVIVVFALNSAVRSFLLPRAAVDPLGGIVFATMRGVFNVLVSRARTYRRRDGIMALYAPTSLLVLLVAWLAVVLGGCTLMFWALGVRPLRAAFTLSGSSLLTLGFAQATDVPTTVLAFGEAVLGLLLVAVLVGYLPTIYAAFARREQAVALLEVRAGSPPSAVEMLVRFQGSGLGAATATMGHKGNLVRGHRRKPHVLVRTGVFSLAAARPLVEHGGGHRAGCSSTDRVHHRCAPQRRSRVMYSCGLCGFTPYCGLFRDYVPSRSTFSRSAH